jgi:hypothetical protein
MKGTEMPKAKFKSRAEELAQEVIKDIEKNIIEPRAVSDETMCEALDEIASFCEDAANAKREEMADGNHREG